MNEKKWYQKPYAHTKVSVERTNQDLPMRKNYLTNISPEIMAEDQLILLQEPSYCPNYENFDPSKFTYSSEGECFTSNAKPYKEYSEEELYEKGLFFRYWEDRGVYLTMKEASQALKEAPHHYPSLCRLHPVKPVGTLKKLIENYSKTSKIIPNTLKKQRSEIYKEEVTRDPIFLIRIIQELSPVNSLPSWNMTIQRYYKTIALAITREEGVAFIKEKGLKPREAMVYCHCANKTLAKVLTKFFGGV